MPAYHQADRTTILGPLKQTESGVQPVSDDWGGAPLDGRVLSEYCQLFWLSNQLINGNTDKRFLVLSQYRKFISLKPGNIRASNVPYSFIATSQDALDLLLSDSQIRRLLDNQKRCITGPVLKVGSIIQNYARYHVLSDFLRFCDQMLLTRQFNPDFVARFTSCSSLIPAPSLGLHPLTEFLSDMANLWKVWQNFYHASYVKREGYQRRVGGFLLERLHSFLIYERMMHNPDQHFIGHQYVVVESGHHAPPTP